MKLGSMLLVSVFVAGVPAGAQSLGEVAQKEKEKRATKTKDDSAKAGAKKPEGKVYTGADLATYADKPAPSDASADAGDGSSVPGAGAPSGEVAPLVTRPSDEAGSGASDEAAQRARQERSWRQRAQSARAAVAAAEREFAAAQKAKASLGIGPQVPDPELLSVYSTRVREADERVTRAQGALANAKTDQANLEEEARREGALPGWLR